MAKIAIVSDSTGCIPAEELKALDIHVNYISIVFGTESYREFIDMTPEEFMERCENYSGLPTTSQRWNYMNHYLHKDMRILFISIFQAN